MYYYLHAHMYAVDVSSVSNPPVLFAGALPIFVQMKLAITVEIRCFIGIMQ